MKQARRIFGAPVCIESNKNSGNGKKGKTQARVRALRHSVHILIPGGARVVVNTIMGAIVITRQQQE